MKMKDVKILNLPHHPSTRILLYEDIAKSFRSQIGGLINIWHMHLPFNDMLLTATITNTANSILCSGRKYFMGYEFGSPVNLNLLKYSKVINKTENSKLVIEYFIKRYVNFFGLNLDNVFDEKGNLNLPSKLYYY
ncbi:MAG: hypothetical protein ACR9NN_08790 [Nostochopsis sp.]